MTDDRPVHAEDLQDQQPAGDGAEVRESGDVRAAVGAFQRSDREERDLNLDRDGHDPLCDRGLHKMPDKLEHLLPGNWYVSNIRGAGPSGGIHGQFIAGLVRAE